MAIQDVSVNLQSGKPFLVVVTQVGEQVYFALSIVKVEAFGRFRISSLRIGNIDRTIVNVDASITIIGFVLEIGRGE